MTGIQWEVEQQVIGISQLSLIDILIPVKVTKSGVSYNPTSDVIKFAFMPTPTQVPQVSDWVTGSWQSVSNNILYPYNAVCLVGPEGTINPGIGTYVIYIDITDSPEAPVLIAGQLQVS